MRDDTIEVYAQFLAQCRKVIGPFDLEKLTNDQEYKEEFFNRVKLSQDDKLFKLAALVDRKLNEESFGRH